MLLLPDVVGPAENWIYSELKLRARVKGLATSGNVTVSANAISIISMLMLL